MKIQLKTLLLGFLSICSVFGNAQELSTFPEMPMTDFHAFDVDGDRIVALGLCDQIWHSSDAGTTWTYQETPEYFYDIKFIPNDTDHKAIVVGEGIYVFDFENGFIQNFNNEPLFQESNSYRNVEVDANLVFVIGAEQVVAASPTDFTWSEIYRDTFTEDYIYTSEIFEDLLFLGGRNGKVVKLKTDSYDWDLMQDFEGWVYNISMGSEDVGYISASGISDVLKTTDGWSSYEELEALPENIQPLAFGEDVVLTINTNRIYLSTDGGQTSTYIETANTPEFSLTYRGLFTPNGDLYFAGRGAMMTKSTDFGMTWTALNPYNRSNLYDTDSDSEGNVVVVGENQTIYYSSDDGGNWTENSIDFSTDDYFSQVAILAPGKYAVTSGEHFMVVENEEVIHATEMYIIKLIFNKSENYFLAIVSTDTGYEIQKSVDEGLTWTTKFSLNDYSSILSNSNSGKLYAGEGSEIYSSEDHGETWVAETVDLQQIRLVEFWDDNIGVVGAGNKLYKTIDGGQTFEEISSGYAIRNFKFMSENHFFFTTASNNSTYLRMTEDGGESFSTFYSNCATSYASTINSKNELILAQRDGHIQIVPLEEINTSSSEPSANLNFKLYPNPTSGADDIAVEGDWNQVEVYDVAGRLRFKQNFHSDKINISELANGVYFVQVTDGSRMGMGKIIIQD